MKNTNTRQAVTYLGAGALLAIIVLFLMGRLRTERYEESIWARTLGLLEHDGVEGVDWSSWTTNDV